MIYSSSIHIDKLILSSFENDCHGIRNISPGPNPKEPIFGTLQLLKVESGVEEGLGNGLSSDEDLLFRSFENT